VTDNQGIIERTSATSLFANVEEMEVNGVTSEEVASWLSQYTIGANIPDGEGTPHTFRNRTNEKIFKAVFPGDKLGRIAACSGLSP
jgi:hypothetical protein